MLSNVNIHVYLYTLNDFFHNPNMISYFSGVIEGEMKGRGEVRGHGGGSWEE